MKLIELLENIDENKNVFVYDENNNLIAIYDGKNSIPEYLNSSEVIKITSNDNNIIINVIALYEIKFTKNSKNFIARIEENYINKIGIYETKGKKEIFLKSFDTYNNIKPEMIKKAAYDRV